jgi:hypothetical protein
LLFPRYEHSNIPEDEIRRRVTESLKQVGLYVRFNLLSSKNSAIKLMFDLFSKLSGKSSQGLVCSHLRPDELAQDIPLDIKGADNRPPLEKFGGNKEVPVLAFVKAPNELNRACTHLFWATPSLGPGDVRTAHLLL